MTNTEAQAKVSRRQKTEGMEESWPFDQAANAAAITTRQVVEDNFPILNVVHYSHDHSWAFTCGTSNNTEDGRVISMGEVLKIDASLAEIADLPPGWCAYRDRIGDTWHRCRND